jgi:hypothetical protein
MPSSAARTSRAGPREDHTVTDELPVGEREYLRHALATLAYRGGKALRGAPEGFGAFKASATSRTPAQILAHVCDLLDWALSQVRGQEAWHDSAPGAWDDDVRRFHAGLKALDDELSNGQTLGRPWTHIFQGAIADAFTHIGQINFLRRLAGAPVKGENYSRADIVRGRVGAEQGAPKREFD